MCSSVIVDIVLIILSGTAIIISLKANKDNSQLKIELYQLNIESKKDIAKKKDVIKLFKYWDKVSYIDKDNIIGPDVFKAANALELTASLWNFDVLDKNMLYEIYWKEFNEFYNVFYNSDILIPGYENQNMKLKDCITINIKIAYEEMFDKEKSKFSK